MPLFEVIDMFLDETGRTGPEQMALDEALLECAQSPLLRVYRWAAEFVSFGYSQSVAQVRNQAPLLPSVRRWTGGGMVRHCGDWTFALVVPSRDPLAKLRPQESYRLIHAEVMKALNELDANVRLAERGDCSRDISCFDACALYDVMGSDHRKLCGGAQRRTRQGFLHQGSIQVLQLPENFAIRLLEVMATKTHPFLPKHSILQRATDLVNAKYSSLAWLERIR